MNACRHFHIENITHYIVTFEKSDIFIILLEFKLKS